MNDAEAQKPSFPSGIKEDAGEGGQRKGGDGETFQAPLPPKHLMIFFVMSTVTLLMTGAWVTFQPQPVSLDSSKNRPILHDSSPLSKGWNPFKPAHDARVYYGTTRDDDKRMMYKRDYVLPCDNGILVLNIGPAAKDAKHDFEIYDDSYLWDNNNGLCPLYPHWKAYQVSYTPLWNPTDPTYYSIRFCHASDVHRISSLIHHHDESLKPVDDGIAVKGGDYMICGKGQFWDPHWYDDLRSKIYSWKKEDVVTDADLDVAIKQAVQELKTE